MTNPHHAGVNRRPEPGMHYDKERTVPTTPVRDADRSVRARGLSLPAGQRAARVSELRSRAFDGYYASDAMMDAVARSILKLGDL